MNFGSNPVLHSGRRDSALRLLENLFLMLTALYLAYAMKGLTMFKPVIPESFSPNLMLVMELLVLALLMLRRHEHSEIWLGLALVGVYVMSYRTLERDTVLFTAILVMGLEGVDYRRIIRTYFVAVGGVLVATIMAGMAGGIENLVYIREGLRSCWGTAYPTDFSTTVLFLAMGMWIAWPELPDWAMLIFGLVPLALAVFITASRNSVICGVLFEMAICYRWLERGVLCRLDKGGKLRRVVDVLLTIAVPLCAGAIYLLVFLYARHPQEMQGLDNMFSWRLSLSANNIQQYGLKPFGTIIPMKGGLGGSVFPKGDIVFIDSSYVNILLRYGWVTMLTVFAAWILTVRKAIRGGNRRMALVMAVVAFHSIMEHHFMDAFDNILLVMPLASLQVKPEKATNENARTRGIAFGMVMAALLALGALFLPGIMSRLRTVFGARGWQGGGVNAWPVLCVNLALVAMVAGTSWAAYRLAQDVLTRHRVERLAVSVLAVCLAFGIGMGAWGYRVIDQATRDHEALVTADAAALKCLADCDIYVDVMPEIYRRQFGNVKQTVIGGDELARLPGSTLLMDNRPEHRLFLDRNYKYVQISDAHALYVADPKAQAALDAGGFSLSGIYNTVTDVDLEALAELNGLNLGPEGLVLGTKQSLTKGPYVDLFNGHYVVEYSLLLPDEAMDTEGDICVLRARSKYLGQLSSTVVTRDQFDSEGCATILLPLDLGGDTIDIRFQTIPKKKRQVIVQGIRYWQVAE